MCPNEIAAGVDGWGNFSWLYFVIVLMNSRFINFSLYSNSKYRSVLEKLDITWKIGHLKSGYSKWAVIRWGDRSLRRPPRVKHARPPPSSEAFTLPPLPLSSIIMLNLDFITWSLSLCYQQFLGWASWLGSCASATTSSLYGRGWPHDF